MFVELVVQRKDDSTGWRDVYRLADAEARSAWRVRYRVRARRVGNGGRWRRAVRGMLGS